MPTSLLLSLPQQWQPLVLALLVSAVSLLLLMRWKGQGRLKLPPGPAKVPLLGNLHQLGSLPHQALRDLAQLHGPVMQLQLGTAPTVVLSSAETAWEVLKAHDLDCCTRPVSPGPRRITYGLKSVGFSPYGAYWRGVRKLLVVELLSARRVKAAWYTRQEQVDRLLGALGTAKQPVALDEHVLRLSDSIIGTLAFGSIYASDKVEHNESFQHAIDEAMEVISSTSAEDFFPKVIGRLVDSVTGVVARRERIFKQLDAFFDMVIEQHMNPERASSPEMEKNGGDLVDALIAHVKEHSGFTKDNVKAIIFDTFIGGIDTSSVTILWAMSELIRKPRVMAKVQAEIRAVAGGDGKARVLPEDVSKLSYLKMAVKETLRLHPAAPLLLPRETMRHIQVAGYDVPAKTRVYVNAWAIGRDLASWPDDPEEFNPDRFEASNIDLKGEHPELMPFGTGRRICPGMSMALTTVEFTLANLLCCFDWVLPEGMVAEDVSMEEEGRLVFHRKTPLMLVPTPYVPSRPC